MHVGNDSRLLIEGLPRTPHRPLQVSPPFFGFFFCVFSEKFFAVNFGFPVGLFPCSHSAVRFWNE